MYSLYHEARVRELESEWGAEIKREAEGMNPIRKLKCKVTSIDYLFRNYSAKLIFVLEHSINYTNACKNETHN